MSKLLVTMKWLPDDPDDADVVPLEGMLIISPEDWQFYCAAVDKWTVENYFQAEVYSDGDRVTKRLENLSEFMAICTVKEISGATAAVLMNAFGGDRFGAVPDAPEEEAEEEENAEE